MNNIFINKLIDNLTMEPNIESILAIDNAYNLNVTYEEIINFLTKISTQFIIPKINNDIIITEGSILDTINIIITISYNPKNYTLYINDTNNLTNTYLIDLSNKIYEELGIPAFIKIDYSRNYNNYLTNSVTLMGSKDFLETAKVDFHNPELIELKNM